MNNIDVSIIVLTYNHEKYISQALESILSQKTSYSYEIVIINNGSDDKTLDIISEYSNKHPDVFNVISKQNKISPTECSLEAMKSCKGKYLASCEGDDFWIDNEKIEKQVSFLEKNEGYVGCTHPVALVGENGEIISKKKLAWTSSRKVFKLKHYDGHRIPGHVSSFVRRNCFLEEDFNAFLIPKAHYYIGDRTNFLLWLEKGNIYRLKDKMSAYRMRGKAHSITRSLYKNSKSHTRTEFEYVKNLQYYIEKKGIKARLKKRFLQLYADSVFDLLKHKKNADRELPKIIRKYIGSLNCFISLPVFLFNKVVKKIKYFY